MKPDSYSMWAPDCVYKDGTYYFYFPSAPREGRGFAVGVATSKSPAGPFTPMDKPIAGVNGIDPCVLQASDGKAYIFWAGGGLRMAKLKDNLVELDSEPQVVEGLPEGFKEGPFAFERQGKYYLTFPWVQDKTETLAYAMSDHPMGPYTFRPRAAGPITTLSWNTKASGTCSITITTTRPSSTNCARPG